MPNFVSQIIYPQMLGRLSQALNKAAVLDDEPLAFMAREEAQTILTARIV